MSCTRMEKRILGFIDGRLKPSEQRDAEVHLAECATCRARVSEFRAVSGLLDELPRIEPSPAFDVRVRARIAAEPVKQSWWTWFGAAPRVLVAASMLLLATVWVGSRPMDHTAAPANNEAQIMQDLPVLENYDVLANFEPLSELSQPVQADDSSQQEM